MTPRRTKFGVHLSNHGSAAESVALAKLAEVEGLDSVWISEDLYFRGAAPIAGAVAAVTSSIEIGFGILSPQIRHAALLAMESAALVDVAGPRLIFGIGAGVDARTRAMAVDIPSPLASVREAVDMYRRLIGGERVTRTEGTQRAADLELSFTDLPAVPPVYVAAVGPKALEQAGRIADGVFLSLMSSRRHIAWALERVQSGATAAGRNVDLPVVVYMPMAIAEESRDAIASLKPVIAHYLRRWIPLPSLASLFTEWGPVSEHEILRMVEDLEAGRPPDSVIPDDLVTDYCIAGDWADGRRQVGELAEAGVTDVVVDPIGDLEAKRSSIRTFGALRRTVYQ